MSTTQNEVKFNDGEGLVLSDLHDMQRFTKSLIVDQLIAQQASYDGQDGLQPSASIVGVALTPAARNGYLSPTANAREITNTPGMVCQWSSSGAPDGVTPKFLSYQLAQDELKVATAANVSGNPRIDALCIKLSYDDSQDSQTRDFEDGTTHIDTSQTMFKKRRTVLAVQLVTGTPGSNPAKPAAPAGYCVYGYIYVPNAAGVLTHDEVWDNRIPMRVMRLRRFAKDAVNVLTRWQIVTPANVYVQNLGSAGSDSFDLLLGVPSGGRLLRVSAFGAFGGALSGNLFGAGALTAWRFDAASYTASQPGTNAFINSLKDPGQAFTTVLTGDHLSGNAYPPFWGNGWPSGVGAEMVGTSAFAGTCLGLRFTDLNHLYTQAFAWVDVWYAY